MMNQNVNKQINTTLVLLSVNTYSERFTEDFKKKKLERLWQDHRKYNVNPLEVYREILSQKNKTIYVYTFPSLIFLGKRSCHKKKNTEIYLIRNQ